MLTVHAVPAFADNYIWLIQAAHSNKVLVVDPGDAEPVLDYLKTQQLSPVAVLITHHHQDHIGGVERLLSQHSIPVYGPSAEQIAVVDKPLTAPVKLEVDAAFPAIDVIDTSGHTQGHISYLIEGNLFCGDTLFSGGCGRLLGGSAEQLFASLSQIKQLPAETKIYCAHEYTQANLRFAAVVEPNNEALLARQQTVNTLREQQKPTVPSFLSEELLSNPFLRCEQSSVINAVATHCGQTLNSPLAVFTELRRWKDQF
jgi:hydroxyacylglutathione hydrolase